MKIISIFILSFTSLIFTSIQSVASPIPLTMVNSNGNLSCIKSQLSNNETASLTLTNDCADIGNSNTGLALTVSFNTTPAGSLYLDASHTTAKLPYPALSQHDNQTTATFANGVWKEGTSITFNWYQNKAPISLAGVTSDPTPSYTDGKLILSETGVTIAAADILTTDTSPKLNQHLELSSSPQQTALAFGQYQIVPYLVTINDTLYQGTLKTPGVITLNKDNSFITNLIDYTAVSNPGHIQFLLSNSVPATSLIFYNNDYQLADHVALQGTGGATAVPAGNYTLPISFQAEALNADGTSYNRCTLTTSSHPHLTVAAGETSKVIYSTSCQTVPAVTVKINLSNDRTLDKSVSHQFTVNLQSTTIPSANFTKTFDYLPGQQAPTISVPGNDTYQISVYVDSSDNALQNYDVVASTLSTSTQDTTLPIELKYKGSYRYLTPSQYQTLLPQVDGKPNFDINIGQAVNGAQIAYQCDYKLNGSKLERDATSCNWKAMDLKQIAAIQPQGFAHTPNELAMALAQGAMLERAELMHGFGATPSFTRDDVGNYFAANINPNSLLSRCTQETATCAYVAGEGPYQLNNIALQLQSADNGGFPMPYALIDGTTLKKHTAVDFIGGTLSAAMFDASDTGLITPEAMNKLAQPTTADSKAIQRVMDWIYNRGTGEFTVFKNFDTCAADPNMIDNPACFPQRDGWGTRYIRQVPNVAAVLNGDLAGDDFIKDGQITQYNSPITWKEIAAYLDTLGPNDLNLYDAYDIASAKKAAHAAFNKLIQASGKSSIDFRTEYGYVLQAIMTKLPVYQYEAVIPTPGSQSSKMH